MSNKDNLSQKIARLSPQKKELLKQKIAKLNKQKQYKKSNNLQLSSSQERIWFLQQLEPDNPTYNRPTNFSLTGKLDIACLEKVLNYIITRHEVFRTTFISNNGIPQLKIVPELNLTLSQVSLENWTEKRQKEKLQTIARDLAQQTFDLTKLPLIRGKLVKINPEYHILFLTIHHIIFDGWSSEVFLRELASVYADLSQEKSISLPPLKIQYQDFTSSSKKLLDSQKLQPQLNYWQNKLKGELPIIELPLDSPRTRENSFIGATHALILSKSLTNSLKSLSQRKEVTLFITLLTVFKILLYRYSSQLDILIGSPCAGRDKQEIENLIGVFINTLVYRTQLDANLTFEETLTKVKQTALEAYTNKDISFEKLVEELQPERHLNITPIFQVFFQLRNFVNERVVSSDLTISKYEIDTGIAPFDLTLDITEINEGLLCKFIYKKQLFDRETIERISQHWQTLLEEIINNPQEKISLLPFLTPQERQQILFDWNHTTVDYPHDKCIHQLFEEQVLKTPDNIAVVFKEEKLTYQQLNEKANKIAHYLIKQGVKIEDKVGICFERSSEMIVGMLAILKAGACYVPIDPNNPRSRINRILEDAHIQIILRQKDLKNQFDSHLLTINLSEENEWKNENKKNTNTRVSIRNLVYVIYTSGTTAKAKGVEIEHRQLLNYVYSIIARLKIIQFSNFAYVSTLAADLGNTSIFTALSTGGILHIISGESILDADYLAQYFSDNNIDTLKITPSHFEELLNQNNSSSLITKSQLIFGGEQLKLDLVKKIQKIKPQSHLFNHYGPTETTIGVCTYDLDLNETDLDKLNTSIPIGRQINNTRVYILDKNLQPLPIGVIGELHVGGDGLARGYLNRPDLTTEKFIDNPFGEGKLYKTGDLCRYLADGNIEYIGRIDNQVKVRGFRIELGEIEATLNQHPQVKETVVIAVDNRYRNKELVAYVTTDNEALKSSTFREYLSNKLPDYTIPSGFIFLDKFPLTSNGKIDRKTLTQIEVNIETEVEFVAPTNKIETQLALIWQEVLGRENIGINDNFFEIGGHSLLATQVISRIRDSLKTELPLRNLFESPTIKQLALSIDDSGVSENKNSISIPVISRKDNLPLSFAQERLWFITQLEGDNSVYNMNTIVLLDSPVNITALKKAIEQLSQRHECLNSNFYSTAGKPYVTINYNRENSLEIVRLDDEKQIADLIQKRKEKVFELENDRLIRFTLIQRSQSQSIVLICIHHIISDGWSMNIITQELSHFYRANKDNQTVSLPPLSIQYPDFAQWQRDYLQGKRLTEKIAYWKEELENAPPLSTFPTDYLRTKEQTFRGASHQLVLDGQLHQQLQQLSNREGVTLFITLLTVLKILLYRHTLQKQLIIGFPVASRNHLEVEKLIGFFANTLLVSTKITQNLGFKLLLEKVKTSVFRAYENQELPFEKLVAEIQPERELNHNPLFQVWFNMVNLNNQDKSSLNSFVPTTRQTAEISSKFDLTIYVRPSESSLVLKWVYNRDLYNPETIEWLAGQYQTLLENIVDRPQSDIESIGLLKSPQLSQNNSQKISIEQSQWQEFLASEIEQSIIDRFEKQVELYPDNIALKSDSQQWSYQQLNREANKIANYILSLDNTNEKQQKIGILLKHNCWAIASILAVLKTGNIYVPLDSNYPLDRLSSILEDSQIKLVLTNDLNQDLALQLKGSNSLDRIDLGNTNTITNKLITVVNIDRIPPEFNLTRIDSIGVSNPENIAYILYTSGSTGQPKGVIQNHRNVLHFIRNQTNNLKLNREDKISLLASINYDAAVMDIFGALLNGATLCLYDLKSPPITSLALWLRQEKITVYHSTPTVYRYLLLKELQSDDKYRQEMLFPHLRLILLGGEEVIKTDVEVYRQYFNDRCLFVNGYGSSESSFNSQYIIEPQTVISSHKVPIGKAMPNTEILLLDEAGNNNQIYGEIGIKSEHVALGYWQQPKLTREVFLSDEQEESRYRIYRTGDYGRLKSDGSLEFLGRKDFQVKIRGIRIELGEIEATLNLYPEIKKAVVVASDREHRGQYLVAYLISNVNDLKIVKIKEYLQTQLPEYTIPSAFVVLDEFPLTPTGKIDRRSLPSTDVDEHLSQEKYVAPTTPNQETLVKIWQQLLEIEIIGIRDNFFELGGHSLLAVQMVHLIAREFTVELSLKDLFNYTTVEQLSDRITQKQLENLTPEQLNLLLDRIEES